MFNEQHCDRQLGAFSSRCVWRVLGVEALYRSHIEAGDLMGASRPRARSVPRTAAMGALLAHGASLGPGRITYRA